MSDNGHSTDENLQQDWLNKQKKDKPLEKSAFQKDRFNLDS